MKQAPRAKVGILPAIKQAACAAVVISTSTLNTLNTFATTYGYLLIAIIIIVGLTAYRRRIKYWGETGGFSFPNVNDQTVSFECYNLKMVQLVMGTISWFGALLFGIVTLGEFQIIPFAITNQIFEATTGVYGFGTIGCLLVLMLTNYAYSPVRLKWDSVPAINNAEVKLLSYYIRDVSIFKCMINLQTTAGSFILAPNDIGYKPGNKELIEQQWKRNFQQVALLRDKLNQQGVPEIKQPLYLGYFIVGICAFLLMILVSVAAIDMHHNLLFVQY